MSEQVKLCPFCGKQPQITIGDDKDPWSKIECLNLECLDEVCIIGAEEKIIKLWNTRAEPQWISVKDRLPEEAPVLIAFLEPFFGGFKTEMGVGHYDSPDYYADGNGDGWCFWLDGRQVKGDGVTHWMPLPEPPKEDKE